MLNKYCKKNKIVKYHNGTFFKFFEIFKNGRAVKAHPIIRTTLHVT